MPKIIFSVLFIFILKTGYSKDQMILFTNDGKSLILEDESRKENSILISKAFSYMGNAINISVVDSIKIGDALYKSIIYKENKCMARLLFSGENEGYKIHFNGEIIIIVKNTNKNDFIKITKENKIGVYNYLFSDCIKKDSNLAKVKSSINDVNITKDVTQRYNCENKPYKTYLQPFKIDVYLGALADLNLYFPSVKAEGLSRVFNHDKVKSSIGYSAGGKVGFVINNKLDISISVRYTKSSAKYTAEIVSVYYTVADTVKYKGYYYNKSLDIDIKFKYLILKSKLSPTISGGIYFSNKFSNFSKYDYTDSYGVFNKSDKVDLASRVIGVNLSVGLNYKPVKRLNLFLDIGFKAGAGLLGPVSYKISEGYFYTSAGFGVKLNK